MCRSSTATPAASGCSASSAALRKTRAGRSRLPPAASDSFPTAATTPEYASTARSSRVSIASRYGSRPGAVRISVSASVIPFTAVWSATIPPAKSRYPTSPKPSSCAASSSGPGKRRTLAGQIRVRLSAGQQLAQQRHHAVEPERVEPAQRAARTRELEDREPATGTQHAPQLCDRSRHVGDVAHAEADRRHIEGRVRKRKCEQVTLNPLELGRLPARPLEHPRGEVEPRHGCARLGGDDSEVAGAARRIEDTVAGPDDGAHGCPAPALIQPGGRDPVHHVVDRRDPVEHVPHAFGRQRAAAHRDNLLAPATDQRILEVAEGATSDPSTPRGTSRSPAGSAR